MKKILVISYFPGNESGSMNLWTKDKISELVGLGFEVDLITSPIIKKKSSKNYRVYNVFSLNPSSYWNEYKSGQLRVGLFLIPIVYTVGLLHEILERIVLRRIGHGMWGWTIPSLSYLLTLIITKKYDTILSLGGPTSSHLATAIASNLFSIPCVIEFQDPIVGVDIGHNSRSAYYFLILEKFLVSSRSKIVFVTKQATMECKERHPFAKNINYTYTSSSRLNITQEFSAKSKSTNSLLKLGYYGQIYSSRNYDSLFAAFDLISKKITNLNFDLSHYGNDPKINFKSLSKYLNFTVREILPRDAAMKEALDLDLLVIIQHTDNRSKLTIPYKTWDYLNLQKPILALLNNDELKELLDDLGHYTCDVNNVDSIADTILRFLDDYKNDKILIKPNPYDISKQVLELISL